MSQNKSFGKQTYAEFMWIRKEAEHFQKFLRLRCVLIGKLNLNAAVNIWKSSSSENVPKTRRNEEIYVLFETPARFLCA
jgi:hypothetical protein